MREPAELAQRLRSFTQAMCEAAQALKDLGYDVTINTFDDRGKQCDYAEGYTLWEFHSHKVKVTKSVTENL